MELVEGEDLSQRIARGLASPKPWGEGGAIPLDEALPIAKQIAEALEAAHEQGIIHRDLKPANIKVRADGTVKVLDFGLAKAMEDADAQSPFARSANYGFRCIKTDHADDITAALTGEAALPSRDLRAVPPVSDEIFRAWQSVYSFDHGNLDARVEAVDDTSLEWRVERVSYAAAYGDERIPAVLLLPKNARPPYQTVIFFPGSGVIGRRTPPGEGEIASVNFVLRSGRALLYPVYKSTHQRGDVIATDYPSKTANWRDHMVMWSKDVGRSMDYLHSRPDIDTSKIGYMGNSWGAGMAPLFLALEPRLSLALLNVGGFYLQEALPEADPVNFAPRVTIPVLMLNGRFDFFFPTETSQEPMFERLGTPAERKRRVVYDASHSIPRNELIKEFVGWMEKYWGATR